MFYKIHFLIGSFMILNAACQTSYQATGPRYNCGAINYGISLEECVKNCKAVETTCNPIACLPNMTRCEYQCYERYQPKMIKDCLPSQ